MDSNKKIPTINTTIISKYLCMWMKTNRNLRHLFFHVSINYQQLKRWNWNNVVSAVLEKKTFCLFMRRSRSENMEGSIIRTICTIFCISYVRYILNFQLYQSGHSNQGTLIFSTVSYKPSNHHLLKCKILFIVN